MNIELLYHTPIDIIAKAASLPYQSKPTNKLVKNVWNTKHRSIARHGMVSFLIEGVSQSLLRQISRHSHIDLIVKSSRYCDMSGADVYVPNIIWDNIDEYNEYIKDMNEIMQKYSKWKQYEKGNGKKDIAKLFLPLASTTDLVVSGNYQALYEFCQLRNCVRAEREIRELSLKMTEILKKIMPEIFKDLGCKGDEYKICPEHDTCGRYPQNRK